MRVPAPWRHGGEADPSGRERGGAVEGGLAPCRCERGDQARPGALVGGRAPRGRRRDARKGRTVGAVDCAERQLPGSPAGVAARGGGHRAELRRGVGAESGEGRVEGPAPAAGHSRSNDSGGCTRPGARGGREAGGGGVPGAQDGVEVEEGVVERGEEALRLPVPASSKVDIGQKWIYLCRCLPAPPSPPRSHAPHGCARAGGGGGSDGDGRGGGTGRWRRTECCPP